MIIKISKLDAAKGQLETAIRLYFENGDVVSIHALTAAAYNVLRDMSNNNGISFLIKDSFPNLIESKYRSKFNEAENFFKHADRDPEGILKFNPEYTELLLFEACIRYSRLASEELPLFYVYYLWFMIQKQEWFEKIISIPEELVIFGNVLKKYDINRSVFFKNVHSAYLGKRSKLPKWLVKIIFKILIRFQKARK